MVAAAADARAANPFESVLRAICLDVPGLGVEAQVPISGALGLDVRPDLVDRRQEWVRRVLVATVGRTQRMAGAGA